jgi:hypothetical protein
MGPEFNQQYSQKERERERLTQSLGNDISPFMRAQLSLPYHLLKISPFNTAALGATFSVLWGHLQTIAISHPLFPIFIPLLPSFVSSIS